MSWRSTRATASSGQTTRQIAVIDLGSNSWRLVVYSYQPEPPNQWWKETDELYETVRIGEGMATSGTLSEAAMDRGLETLIVFDRFCRAAGLTVEDVHVIATSAIRDADNQGQYLERISAATGYEVEVLSAHDEAHYGYVAAVNTTTLTDGVVLDIGGGSMQLINVVGRREIDSVSYPLGAVRATEQFLSDTPASRPTRRKDLQRVRDHVEKTLRDAPWLTEHGGRLVGTGGAVRNLAAAAQRAAFGSVGGIDIGVQGFLISADALGEVVSTLAALPPAERDTVPGIKPGRADIILAAAVTLQTVLAVGAFDGIEVTEAGLREGIFLARTLLDEADPLFPDVREAAVRNLAIQYEADLQHTEHVARLALQMHDSLVRTAHVQARARRGGIAVGRGDAPRRRDDDLL